jgi:hypothetical protein
VRRYNIKLIDTLNYNSRIHKVYEDDNGEIFTEAYNEKSKMTIRLHFAKNDNGCVDELRKQIMAMI